MVEFQGALNRVSGLMLFGRKAGLVLAGSMWYDVIWIMLNEHTSWVSSFAWLTMSVSQWTDDISEHLKYCLNKYNLIADDGPQGLQRRSDIVTIVMVRSADRWPLQRRPEFRGGRINVRYVQNLLCGISGRSERVDQGEEKVPVHIPPTQERVARRQAVCTKLQLNQRMDQKTSANTWTKWSRSRQPQATQNCKHRSIHLRHGRWPNRKVHSTPCTGFDCTTSQPPTTAAWKIASSPSLMPRWTPQTP